MQLTSIILINCPLYVTPYLKLEVEALGYSITWEHANGVEIKGSLEDCIRLNYCLRTASKVLWMIKKVKAADGNELFNRATEVAWENYLRKDVPFTVTSFTRNGTVNTTLYTNLKVKDAIADRFRQKIGYRPDSGSEKVGAVVFVFWDNHDVSLYLDTSGESLNKRGYRKIPFAAPLQENLGAGIIMATGWDGNSSFVNPMCGSGTFAIEAALMALNRYPGHVRKEFAFMHLKDYDENFYRDLDYEYTLKVKNEINFRIIASDIDGESIANAKQNAVDAGVREFIEFVHCPVQDTPVPETKGIVLMNPPYGMRIGGDEESLIKLYKTMGDFMKRSCSGYKGYVFTGNLEVAKFIGLKPKRKIRFMNAQVDCKLFGFDLYEGKKYSGASEVSE